LYYGAFEFILAGMLVGFCVGITGVGGGSLMTPILISLFRIEPHIAICSSTHEVMKDAGILPTANHKTIGQTILSFLA
jgi:hypothetical protein